MPVKNKVESHIFIINIIHIYLFTSLVRIVQQHILCLKLVHLISSSDIFKWAYCMLLASNREGNKKTFRRLRASGHEMFFLIQAYCMLLASNREGKKTFLAVNKNTALVQERLYYHIDSPMKYLPFFSGLWEIIKILVVLVFSYSIYVDENILARPTN